MQEGCKLLSPRCRHILNTAGAHGREDKPGAPGLEEAARAAPLLPLRCSCGVMQQAEQGSGGLWPSPGWAAPPARPHSSRLAPATALHPAVPVPRILTTSPWFPENSRGHSGPSCLSRSLGSRAVWNEKLLMPFGCGTFTNGKFKINYDFHRNPIMQIVTIFFKGLHRGGEAVGPRSVCHPQGSAQDRTTYGAPSPLAQGPRGKTKSPPHQKKCKMHFGFKRKNFVAKG